MGLLTFLAKRFFYASLGSRYAMVSFHSLRLSGLCHIRDWQCGQISWNSRSESIQPNRQQQQQQQQMLSAFMMTTGMVVLFFSLIE